MQFMKALFLLAMAFAAIGVGNGATRETFERGIRKLIDKCKSGYVYSLPVDFPSLNPLEVSPIKMKVKGYTLSLGTMIVRGLEDLSIEYLSADPDGHTVSIEIYVPRVSLKARYSLQGGWLFWALNDNGDLTSTIRGLKIKANIRLGRFVSGPHKDKAAIYKSDLSYTANDIEVYLSDSGSDVRDSVNELTSNIVNSYGMTTIHDGYLKKTIESRLDECVWSHTSNELIDIISEL